MDERSPGNEIPIEEFRALALAELPAVHRLAFHLAHDAAEADDLVQETYLRALRAAEKFRLGSSGMRSWLFRILHNTLRNRWRAAAAVPTVQRIADGLDCQRLAVQPEVAGNPSHGAAHAGAHADHVDWDYVDERLAAAVRALPPDFREPFLLFAVEDMKYREIAAVLDLPIGTVMSRLARARRQLMEKLGGKVEQQSTDEGMTRTSAQD